MGLGTFYPDLTVSRRAARAIYLFGFIAGAENYYQKGILMRGFLKWRVGIVNSVFILILFGCGVAWGMSKLCVYAPAAIATKNRRSRAARLLWLGFSTAVVLTLLVSFCG